MEKKLTVVYDDGCPMCTVGANFADSQDKNEAMEFVGMNTERGKALIDQHGLNMNESAYVLTPDGTRVEKSEMIRAVLVHNGFWGFLFSLPFRIPYIGDLLYSVFAWIRWHITTSQK